VTATAPEAVAADAPARASRRVSWAAWSIGFFCDSYSELFNIVVPLWALYLGYSPFEIGLLVGARSVLSFLLAIHGGALVDRFGTSAC
jgi:MFS family permease